MFDVASFLVRWLFLSGLARDLVDLQTLPYTHHHDVNQHIQEISRQYRGEEEWRRNCLLGISSCPPGSQRIFAIDAMRAELVNKLSESLHHADQVVHDLEFGQDGVELKPPGASDDPYLDADLEILDHFGVHTSMEPDSPQAVLVISDGAKVDSNAEPTEYTHSEPMSSHGKAAQPTTPQQTEQARLEIEMAREYLPQLVSAVLKSPPAFQPTVLNPIDKLRRLIVQRCMDDANWGVNLCWLLEAEVGRAWKTLFEHRQQTGRRLIVVLPAEKAAVLSKIGAEKGEAFDMLQDSEQVTAFGSPLASEEGFHDQQRPLSHPLTGHSRARLPSSLSLRRCSHFGDTMHFIDRLTRVSLDMRRIPTSHRHAFLQHSLEELNRRIRRRMLTQGDVSLDVEDNMGPGDWPQHSDMPPDMLHYSFHLPLEPKQGAAWPGGEVNGTNRPGVCRVLNVVVDECRTLSSRERCPFLVHVEVADTGLSGQDSRLYTNTAHGLGATIKEALSIPIHNINSKTRLAGPQQPAAYEVPSELLETIRIPSNVFRGGYQTNDSMFGSPCVGDDVASGPYNDIRQHEVEQLHRQMYVDQGVLAQPPLAEDGRGPPVTTGEFLLSKVFGIPWVDKCEEIRQASPFGMTKGWRLASFIVKAGEDIRQEVLVMQIISRLNDWFQAELPEQHRPHLRPYSIMCVGGDAGLVECLSDAISIDEVKKRTDGFVSLRDYFERAYGPPTTQSSLHNPEAQRSAAGTGTLGLSFEQAQDNFLRSLVGYSLVCYILQIKDRHNANILIDRDGNVMHIDFGFVLGDSPKMGRVPLFSERAPFKLSTEFWEVLGGWNVHRGGLGVRFCRMFEQAFACASAHADEIASLVEATMLTLTQSPYKAKMAAKGVQHRLQLRGPPGSTEQKLFIMELVNAALTSWGTSTYDWLQKNMNGYL